MKEKRIDIRQAVFKDALIYFICYLLISVVTVGSITFYSYHLAKSYTRDTSNIAVKKIYAQKQREMNQIIDLHTAWDQCYQNVVLQYNDEWVKKNIGYDISQSFGMDLILVLDQNANIVSGFEKGQSINPQLLTVGNYKDLLLAYETQPKPPLQRSTVISHGSKLYLASIAQIMPSNHELAPPNGSTRYMLFAIEFDQEYLNDFNLQEVVSLKVTKSLTADDAQSGSNIPLLHEGEPLAYLTWIPKTTVSDLLWIIIPLIIGVLIFLSILSFIIIRRITKAAHQYEVLITELFSTTKNLMDAKHEIEKSSTEKSMFLANISHEIKTPMNGIMGMISLMRETILDQKQTQYLNTMHRSTNALMTMIDNILEFSNMQLKGETVKYGPVDMRKLLANIEELLAPVAFQKGIGFSIHFAPTFPEKIISDELRLRQAILQFTTNAIKFTQTGSVQIHISHNLRGEETDDILVQIIDTGIGIADSIKNQMFKEFFQGDSSITRAFDGSGLGLTLARSAVSAIGGKIGVESKVGKGSTFWFRFPLGSSKDLDAQKTKPLELRATKGKSNTVNAPAATQ